MQYYRKMQEKIREFCCDQVATGFEVNYLQSSNSAQCQKILAIYEQASEIIEEVDDIAERDAQLSKLYEDLLVAVA